MARPLVPCRACAGPKQRRGLYCDDCQATARKRGGSVGLRDQQRGEQFALLYRTGKTLEEIGAAFGITRERVRQVLRKVGVEPREGGAAVRGMVREIARQRAIKVRRDRRALRWYGCDWDTLLKLNGGKPGQTPGTIASRFHNQKHSAQCRGIEWELTFPEWLRIWRESGHFDERGKGGDRYCMARKGDHGPYAVDNVYITTNAENGRDMQSRRRARDYSQQVAA